MCYVCKTKPAEPEPTATISFCSFTGDSPRVALCVITGAPCLPTPCSLFVPIKSRAPPGSAVSWSTFLLYLLYHPLGGTARSGPAPLHSSCESVSFFPTIHLTQRAFGHVLRLARNLKLIPILCACACVKPASHLQPKLISYVNEKGREKMKPFKHKGRLPLCLKGLNTKGEKPLPTSSKKAKIN